MTADLGPAAQRETWCVCGAPHRGPCTRCVLVDAAPPRPIPTLEDRDAERRAREDIEETRRHA